MKQYLELLANDLAVVIFNNQHLLRLRHTPNHDLADFGQHGQVELASGRHSLLNNNQLNFDLLLNTKG